MVPALIREGPKLEVAPAPSWAGWLPAALAAAALAGSLFRHGARLDHDAAMYMSCAAQLLAGARPYLDLVEVNPPLAWVVYVVPELAAQRFEAFHLPPAI